MSRWPSIVTACWSRPPPLEVWRIVICRGLPRGQKGYRKYAALAPGQWMWSVSDDEFVARYTYQLAQLEPHKLADQLSRLSAGRPIALMCFEKPGGGTWCHRALVARWLSAGIGQTEPELGFEHFPACSHPLLPSSLAMPGGE